MGWMTEGSEFEHQKDKEFSLLHILETDSGVQPTSYPGALSLEVKRPWREADD
jgi:hypothetical protein